MLSSLAILGCNSSEPDSATKSASTSARSDVPLRVVFDGPEQEAEAIKRSYGSAAEQVLSISCVNSRDPGRLGEIIDQVKNSDVAIVSQATLGALIKNEAIVDINDDILTEYDSKYGRSYIAIDNSSARYDGSRWGVAAGAKPLAVLSTDPDLSLATWDDYFTWVNDGKESCAEPLAEHWAASSFLNRCSRQVERGWLFDRLSLAPLIKQDGYVDALEGLKQCAAVYKSLDMTPTQVYAGVREGKLLGGIGAETLQIGLENEGGTDVFDVSTSSCPIETETKRLWLGPETMLACLSTGCRQTEASRQFLGWISGATRESGLHRQTDSLSPTRESIDIAVGGETTGYGRWAKEQLTDSLIVTGPWMSGGARYYQVLDQEIRACLTDNKDPRQTLDRVASAWDSITDELGRDQQIAAWRKLDV
ncbi:hypothetical protein LOC67_26030 [Stieleria sp. JC731]|uniref:hypothetical protein n=1 Tax=Stieleria sp. JC731 TaxID=2894195 RepID=UPI001E337F48|nr:hypothetical protein [Stieleria sp. JC731]MCC9604027.1 hypothetical protein [Stieleria sp. JC731]